MSRLVRKDRPFYVHWAGTTREQPECGSTSTRAVKNASVVSCPKCLSKIEKRVSTASDETTRAKATQALIDDYMSRPEMMKFVRSVVEYSMVFGDIIPESMLVDMAKRAGLSQDMLTRAVATEKVGK